MRAVPVELDATQAAPLATAATMASAPAAMDATATSPGRVGGGAAAVAIAPGVRLAHFEIVRPLGAGGMGEVYLATDLALDRPVALKVLPAAVARDPGRRERLVREARAQARLNHANVAHIYFIGEDLGHLFFAMEFIDGETLGQRLERGPLSAEEALEVARMAALGLREAHRHGFTHRDVKPSNLMVDRHGQVKVMDFGLVADSVDATAPALADDAEPTAAAASALVGTPLYMAPEQGQGRAVDHRADIYALGATLHHMIAGRPPFAGGSAAELQSLHESSMPAALPSGRGRRTAGLANAVIARMMAKRIADRPPSYDELIADLDHANPARSRPAGFFVRTAAAAVDFMLSALLAIPFAVLFDADGDLAVPIVLLVTLPLLVARLATTAGHALFELTVVSRRGQRVKLTTAMLRYLVMAGPLCLGLALESIAGTTGLTGIRVGSQILTAIGLAYPLGALGYASLATADARPVWDRIAGTRVSYRVRGAPAPAARGAAVGATSRPGRSTAS